MTISVTGLEPLLDFFAPPHSPFFSFLDRRGKNIPLYPKPYQKGVLEIKRGHPPGSAASFSVGDQGTGNGFLILCEKGPRFVLINGVEFSE